MVHEGLLDGYDVKKGTADIDRRRFFARAAALGLGSATQGLLPSANAWAVGETTKERELVILHDQQLELRRFNFRMRRS